MAPADGPRSTFDTAAYGGAGWSPRAAPLREELGTIWAACGSDSEWATLRAVLLHRPGAELVAPDPNAVQMLARVDVGLAQAQFDALEAAYQSAGVTVHALHPAGPISPNQLFVADLMFMTPDGAVLARPASTVRAGEERQVARRLADLGIPIIKSLHGQATFEGADAAWLDRQTVMIGRGLRTNAAALAQLTALLAEMNVTVLVVDLPYGTMHLMGMVRFGGPNLAIGWPRRTPFAAVEALRTRGYDVVFVPDEAEADHGKAFNFVTLGPDRILMAAGNPVSQAFYESLGIACVIVEVDELAKAAGAIGCMTGILWRDSTA